MQNSNLCSCLNSPKLGCSIVRDADWLTDWKISYFLTPITECVKWRWIQSATIMCCIYDSCFKRCYVKWNDPWLICIQVTQWSRSRDNLMGRGDMKLMTNCKTQNKDVKKGFCGNALDFLIEFKQMGTYLWFPVWFTKTSFYWCSGDD